jgi:NOL1/NOP2/fmu family ribosome biogenesis protein
MFRKDRGESLAEWNAAAAEACAARQRKIIQDVWGALRQGGLLVYSTCTYTIEENEDVIRFIVEELGAEPLPLPCNPGWGITSALRGDYPLYRFFPHRTQSEGFSLAVLRKSGRRQIEKAARTKKSCPLTASSHQGREIARRLLRQPGFVVEQRGGMLYALPEALAEDCRTLSKRLRVLSIGIPLGEWKGRDFVPTHALAMSTLLDPSAFPVIELTEEMAIRYLQKESIVLPEKTVRGYVLLAFKGVPLGFVKQLEIRTNNLYPASWRIRMTSGTPVSVLP